MLKTMDTWLSVRSFDIASQGDSIEQALANLKEAVEGFFEVASQTEIEGRLKKPAFFTHFEVTRA